jgi:hypothetical protein
MATFITGLLHLEMPFFGGISCLLEPNHAREGPRREMPVGYGFDTATLSRDLAAIPDPVT